MKKVFFIAMLSAAVVFAENTDSLKAELQRIEAELLKAEIEKKSEMLRRIRQGEQQDPTDAQNTEPTANEDTVISTFKVKTITKDDGEKIDTTIKTIGFFPKMFVGRNTESDKWKANDYIGIGGGAGIGAMYLDTRHVKDFLKYLENTSAYDLKKYGISNKLGKREPAFITGGFGYSNIGNGTIVGGGGYGVVTEIVSNADDSLCVTKIGVGYGGFIIGGGWYKGRNSLSLTSLIGAGGYAVNMEIKPRSKRYVYDNKFNFDDDNDGAATFFALELQAAYTRSIFRWFHIGGEISGLFMYSRNGFNYDGSFYTINPSARINFIFGSI